MIFNNVSGSAESAAAKSSRKWLHLLTALIMAAFIFSAAVIITLAFRPIYRLSMDLFDIAARSGYTEDVIIENYNILIDYNMQLGNEPLVFADFEMSETGRIHFEEVKVIFDAFKYICIVSGILSLFAVLYFRSIGEYLYQKLTAVVLAVIPIVPALAIFFFPDRAFVIFHQIFFNNDYWIFDSSTDPIIKILPDSFFFLCALVILGLAFIGGLLCYMSYKSKKKHIQKNENTD